ncbi:glycosyl hydrolase family 18 protein [Microbacterium sp. NPDC057650]|uniref:glycosyl hydrolase family 18 protein n=1 Tax=unclassified Microbacterium TaxID=2609290 RepID=UPI00366D76BF
MHPASDASARRRRLAPVVVLGSLALAASVLPVAAAAAGDTPQVSIASDTVPGTTTINGYRNVGYYGQWMANDPATSLKTLFTEGAHSGALTHLNYSFGNVAGSQESLDAARAAGVKGLDGVKPYTCFISDGVAPAAGETETAGEAQTDFVRAYTADESVLGIADTRKQKLAGAMNQVVQLKKINPDLRVLVSLGGWSWSKSFSKAVATPENRTALVQSCIDIYLDGNLPVIDGRGGTGAAAGLFDGFDLDWEWPGAPDWAQEVGNSVDPVNDRANFLAFVQELRAALDAREAKTGREFEISAFLPASPGVITAGGWNDPELWENLDFGNLQGYDLWGTWDPRTGHQGNVYGDPDHNWGLGLDTIVAGYKNAGVPAAKLNLGLAAYGQGWKDADPQPWQQSGGGIAGGTRTWDQLKTAGLAYTHELNADGAFNATYGYNASTREWFSLDDPTAVAEKTKWAVAQGLGGVDYWQIAGDAKGDLSKTGADALRAAVPGPIAGDEKTVCAATPIWNAGRTYVAGDRVTLDGKVFEALWYAKGTMPGTTKNSPWQTDADCAADPAAGQPWFADHVYEAGDVVVQDGIRYTARWWTRGDAPGGRNSPWRAG